MPRYRDRWDDYYNNRYDYYYEDDDGRDNECQCYEYEEDDEVIVRTCALCEDQRARQEAAEAAAALARQERTTPFYTEITTLRGLMDHIESLADPTFFEARIQAFRNLFTTLLGYETFLAAKPTFRAAVVSKLAETRTNPHSEPLKGVMDQLDALLARLPEVEGYVADN